MSVNLPEIKELFKAGVHFGHQRARSDARAKDFIYGFQNRIAVINLEKTQEHLKIALNFIEKESQNGAMILFVGTKLQAKDKVKAVAESLNMPYVIERWPGGMITNFEVVSKSIRKMIKIEKDIAENKYEHFTKKERLKIDRELAKMHMTFGGLRLLDRIPDAIMVVDAKEEENAIKEGKCKEIPVIAICDSNANPRVIDYPIPANDDSKSSIALILDLVSSVVKENYKPRVKQSDTEERIEKKFDSKENVEKKAEVTEKNPITSDQKTPTKES